MFTLTPGIRPYARCQLCHPQLAFAMVCTDRIVTKGNVIVS